MILCRHPVMQCNIVVFFAQAQCEFLYIWAFMDYTKVVQPCINFPDYLPHSINSKWMGTFTDQLHSDEHIPPDMNIEKPVLFTYPDHIIKVMYHKASVTVCPFECIYSGPGGVSHHVHTSHTYTGKIKFLAAAEPQPGHSTQGATSLTLQPQQGGKVPGQHKANRGQQGS
ncbi:hypothetical protein PAXRUDRAFT_163086 [Paxillus rubicundulus Ve08.2h10]|uniref:Uncharacterized protein n=1 Tax=Paxillus rubicundulus Ve08.2h10 TaxID=930991 RepID=A0A0D0DDF5_9AGAM|nr:hypothetical protein PAXRUDRAFT_163086 [Paxillus rubicundulus Ve08.2h10]